MTVCERHRREIIIRVKFFKIKSNKTDGFYVFICRGSRGKDELAISCQLSVVSKTMEGKE